MAGESTLPNAHTVRFHETNLHALSERWDGAEGKVPTASLLHPRSSVGEQDSPTLHLRTLEEDGTLG